MCLETRVERYRMRGFEVSNRSGTINMKREKCGAGQTLKGRGVDAQCIDYVRYHMEVENISLTYDKLYGYKYVDMT